MKSFPDPKKNSFTISMDKKAAKNSKKDAILPSASLLYGGSLWHAFDALMTSNSTQYLKNRKTRDFFAWINKESIQFWCVNIIHYTMSNRIQHKWFDSNFKCVEIKCQS